MGYKRRLINGSASKLRCTKKKCVDKADPPQLHLEKKSANAAKIYSKASKMGSSYKEETDNS